MPARLVVDDLNIVRLTKHCTTGTAWLVPKTYIILWAQLVEKAKKIAVALGNPEFKSSNSWLEKWTKTYNTKRLQINGE